jgi:hypothetical protein
MPGQLRSCFLYFLKPLNLLTQTHLGSRVKMSPKRLKHLILPPSSHAQHIYIRALLPTSHSRIAHVFATRFRCGDRSVLWITQLCVHASNRNQGIAKALLQALPHEEGQIVGILSSQPFAIAAVLRVFGSGVEIVENELEITGRMAREVDGSLHSLTVPYLLGKCSIFVAELLTSCD